MEGLIWPSKPAEAHASLTLFRLAPGSRPSTSSTKADLLGPVSLSRPLDGDGASTDFAAPLPLAPFDLALPFADGLASSWVARPFDPRLPVRPSLERSLPKRLSLIVPPFPAADHAWLTASSLASGLSGRNPSRNADLP